MSNTVSADVFFGAKYKETELKKEITQKIDCGHIQKVDSAKFCPECGISLFVKNKEYKTVDLLVLFDRFYNEEDTDFQIISVYNSDIIYIGYSLSHVNNENEREGIFSITNIEEKKDKLKKFLDKNNISKPINFYQVIM